MWFMVGQACITITKEMEAGRPRCQGQCQLCKKSKACLGYRRPIKNKPLRKLHRSENIGVCYDLCIKQDGEYEHLYWLEVTCKNSQVDNYKKLMLFPYQHKRIKQENRKDKSE